MQQVLVGLIRRNIIGQAERIQQFLAIIFENIAILSERLNLKLGKTSF
jgi:hypothetical protein